MEFEAQKQPSPQTPVKEIVCRFLLSSSLKTKMWFLKQGTPTNPILAWFPLKRIRPQLESHSLTSPNATARILPRMRPIQGVPTASPIVKTLTRSLSPGPPQI